MDVYDYVVVGAGSSGCVAAAGLARGRARVLLLESGPRAEAHPETLDADGYKDAFINDAIIRERFSTPQTHAARSRVFLGSGAVMGGSGSVNGMVYTRGAREDWDEWPVGWRWEEVAPDFERLERVLRPHRRPPTAWTEACIDAAERNGFRRKQDLNDGDLNAVVGYEWMNYEGDRRRSSYVAFIADAPSLPGLTVETGTHVRRLVFDETKRVVQVEFESGATVRSVGVAREVILCAGALETPKLLLLSGVGPAPQLREHGIPVVVDQPGVGTNLQDHPNVPVFCRTARDVDARYPQLYSFYRTNADSSLPPGQADTCYVYWPAPSSIMQMAMRVLPAKILPQSLYGARGKRVVRGLVRGAFALSPVRNFTRGLFGIIVILGKPRSRGRLVLRSTDPRDAARIDPAYYSAPEDLETMVRGVRKARAILSSGALAEWQTRELLPGSRAATDQAIARYVRRNTITTYHYAGTCRMGGDAAAVVDTRLRLRGARGVRVADASVIPTVPVSALNAPSMLVGLRVAEYVHEDGQAGVR